VRYRLAKLHELFGEELDSPTTRAQLVLVLAWGAPEPSRTATSRESTHRDVDSSLPRSGSGPARRFP
jgi:hypothetical protein